MLRSIISSFRVHAHTPQLDFDDQWKDEGDGWTRVTNFWKNVVTGEGDPESRFLSQTAMYSGFVGFLYGGLIMNTDSVREFIRKHNDYTFEGKYEARRRLVDYTTMQFLRIGWKCSWRIALLSTSAFGLSYTFMLFRNDVHFLDIVASSALAGGLYKFKLGPRAMVSGAIIAGFLGIFCASAMKLYLHFSKQTFAEFRFYVKNDYTFYLHKMRAHRNEALMKEGKKLKDEKCWDLLLEQQDKLKKIEPKDILWSEGFFTERK